MSLFYPAKTFHWLLRWCLRGRQRCPHSPFHRTRWITVRHSTQDHSHICFSFQSCSDRPSSLTLPSSSPGRMDALLVVPCHVQPACVCALRLLLASAHGWGSLPPGSEVGIFACPLRHRAERTLALSSCSWVRSCPCKPSSASQVIAK